MASNHFTFVNTTGSPSLDDGAARRVRGHVTRSNFATKRERKAKGPSVQRSEQRSLIRSQPYPPVASKLVAPQSELEVAVAVSLAISRANPQGAATLLNEFWSLIFVNDGDEPGGYSNATWLTLLASESALVEATMAAAMRCWSISNECQIRAEAHNVKALQMLTQRAGDMTACSDGFLAAAMTMAVNERFFHNLDGWLIHIGGLAQAVRERRMQGQETLPPIFVDMLILDSVNDVFDSPRVYHQSIVDELSNEDGELLRTISATTNGVKRLIRLSGECPPRSIQPAGVECELEEMWTRAYADCQALRSHQNSNLRAATLTLELILLLSRTPVEKDTTWRVADELRSEVDAIPGRSCFLMDLTSCQLIVGAISAKHGSQAQVSFVKRLRKAVQAMRLRGGTDPFAVLERTVMVDANITERLRSLRTMIDPHIL